MNVFDLLNWLEGELVLAGKHGPRGYLTEHQKGRMHALRKVIRKLETELEPVEQSPSI